MLTESMSFGGQIQVQFRKTLWPNTYHLIIDNRDADRAIEFQGGWEKYGAETNYYVLMNNGNRHYFSSSLFEEIGIKGRLWIYPGQKTTIPFKFSSYVMKNAQSMVFNGFSFIPVKDNGAADTEDLRALSISYDIKKRSFEIVMSDKPIKIENQVRFNKNAEKKTLGVEEIAPLDSFKTIDIDTFGKPAGIGAN